MDCIHVCECGQEDHVSWEALRAGSVHKCSRCKRWWGAVRSEKRGGTVWVPIEADTAKFLGLRSTP